MKKNFIVVGYKYDKNLCLEDVHVIAPPLEREVQYLGASRKGSDKLPVPQAFSNFVLKNQSKMGDIAFLGFGMQDFLRTVSFSCMCVGSSAIFPWAYVNADSAKNHYLDLEEVINNFTVERFKHCVGKETVETLEFDKKWSSLGKNAEQDAHFAFALGMLLGAWS